MKIQWQVKSNEIHKMKFSEIELSSNPKFGFFFTFVLGAIFFGLFTPISSSQSWEINMLRLKELVKLEDAVFISFLQPSMGIGGVQASATPNINDFSIMAEMKEL